MTPLVMIPGMMCDERIFAPQIEELVSKRLVHVAPTGHSISIREVRLSAGAEFVVVVCGAIMTMPGLPRVPAADKIKLDENGLVQGLF